MADQPTLVVDGVEVAARPGDTILTAADRAGIYIPRLCHHEALSPHGSCRLCTVFVNGRPQAACTTPATPGLIVENDSERLLDLRRSLVEMLFVEGNHFCMFCERSGHCELQAMAYRLGITAPRYPFLFPRRTVDATHPDALLDRDRCILCARCARASRELDGKHELGFIGRGPEKRLAADARDGLAGTRLASTDRALEVCPVGALLKKRVGYVVPVGQRPYDKEPIGTEVESRGSEVRHG
jgi:[NiFe] hydrogenase diaphorase moiety small subunit